MGYELAQVNIARLSFPIDGPELASFVAALDPVNAAADAADGFVWRLQSESGNATDVQAFAWDAGDSHGVIVNMSTWRDTESLRAFVYSAAHLPILRRRREWFQGVREAITVCWWVPAGHRPSTDEAEDRLRRLRADGPTPAAFTLTATFPPPGVLDPA